MPKSRRLRPHRVVFSYPFTRHYNNHGRMVTDYRRPIEGEIRFTFDTEAVRAGEAIARRGGTAITQYVDDHSRRHDMVAFTPHERAGVDISSKEFELS
jgi:hypothetical protein